MNAPDPTNMLEYLIIVAPVAAVLGVACWSLWGHNQKLTEKIYERDMANLATLEKMLAALVNLERQGNHNFDELRNHISREISSLKRD
jgi:hypothetical protein